MLQIGHYGGAANDSVDASQIAAAYPVDLVFSGGAATTILSAAPASTFAVYSAALSASDLSYAVGHWTVTTGTEGIDTLSGVERVTDGGGHHDVLVSADRQYTTSQAAVNAAVNGDIILVAAGSYDENVTIGGKALTLEGFGSAYGIGGAVLHGSITETGDEDNQSGKLICLQPKWVRCEIHHGVRNSLNEGKY